MCWCGVNFMEQASTALEINTTNLTVKNALSLQDKLQILADAAKYDVACTSSGVERKGKEGFLGNSKACGICHSFASDGRCISLLKILMTNHCVYDCKYCINRKSNDVVRATFTPDEICQLTIEFYKRNYIEGLFLSSGVLHNPTYTMERLCETLQLLRTKYHFNGYIHVKTIPGAPLFDGVEIEDMVCNKGVAGFFARGYYYAPENAEVCLTFTDGKAISYIDRHTTNGTIIVHAGQNLLGYNTSKNTTKKIKKFVNLLIVVR